jgi:hypothetical protein
MRRPSREEKKGFCGRRKKKKRTEISQTERQKRETTERISRLVTFRMIRILYKVWASYEA